MEAIHIDPQQTVANLVLDHSECAAVFQHHRIDFCCRGELTITEAAKSKGVELGALTQELSLAIADRRGDRALDPRELSTPRLGRAHRLAPPRVPAPDAALRRDARREGGPRPR